MRSKALNPMRLGALVLVLVLAAGATPALADKKGGDHPRYVTRHDHGHDDRRGPPGHHRGRHDTRFGHRGHRPPPIEIHWGRVYDHRDWRNAWRGARHHHHRRDAWSWYLPYHDRYWGHRCNWRHTPHRHVNVHGRIVIRLGD